MDEELVFEANRRMKKNIRLGNIFIYLLLGAEVFLFIVINVLSDDKLSAILLVTSIAMASMFLITVISLWKQKAIFNVALSLLHYIDTNYPDVRLPSFEEEEKQ
jgi:hypothetical protein